MTTYTDLRQRVRAEGLDIFGAFHPDPSDGVPEGTATLVLLGPDEPGFWARVTAAPEFADQGPDPLDRWSARVIGSIADATGSQPLFPFGGPPWQPFIAWATRSGRAWTSPVTLLVHDTSGLMVSYRGALAFAEPLEIPAPGPRPCDTCATKPCLSACPVGALTGSGYDIPSCRTYLSTPEGKRSCMSGGCQVRRACPVSKEYDRDPAQSAYHMGQFAE